MFCYFVEMKFINFSSIVIVWVVNNEYRMDIRGISVEVIVVVIDFLNVIFKGFLFICYG